MGKFKRTIYNILKLPAGQSKEHFTLKSNFHVLIKKECKVTVDSYLMDIRSPHFNGQMLLQKGKILSLEASLDMKGWELCTVCVCFCFMVFVVGYVKNEA